MNDDRGGLREVEVNTGVDGALRGRLTCPAGRARAAVAALRPVDDGTPDDFLIRHLERVLPPMGVAVLRYEGRAAPGERSVPLPDQAADALAAVGLLRRRCGPIPVGLWGFGRGGWAASSAAAQADFDPAADRADVDPATDVAFLILVSVSGVSPAQQSRHQTAERVRRAGYGDEALAELLDLRIRYERYLRGDLDPAAAQKSVDAVADRPWFGLAEVARTLPPAGEQPDLDFDPGEAFRTVRCPALLFYGEDDRTVPTAASIEAWRRIALAADGEGVGIVRLPAGTTHLPTTGPRAETDTVSPEYTRELTAWLADLLDDLAEPSES